MSVLFVKQMPKIDYDTKRKVDVQKASTRNALRIHKYCLLHDMSFH